MNTEQRAKVNWKLVAFRVVVLLTPLMVVALVAVAYVFPTSADKAAELRILDKWGVYAPGSNIAMAPDRIIEYLPDGQTASYSSELEFLGSSANAEYKCRWYILHGIFITEFKDPHVFNSRILDQAPITWIDDDNFVLTMTAPDGKPTSIRYRRLSADEQEKLRGNSQ